MYATEKSVKPMRTKPTVELVTQMIAEGKSALEMADFFECTKSHMCLFIRKNNIPYEPAVKKPPKRTKTVQGIFPMPVPRAPMVDLYPVEVRKATPEEIAALEKIPRPSPLKFEVTTGRRR
jgi:hypothetical protein